jgi:hypothetical protein
MRARVPFVSAAIAAVCLLATSCCCESPNRVCEASPAPASHRSTRLLVDAAKARSLVGPVAARGAPTAGSTRFEFTVLHRTLYRVFTLGERPEGNDILSVAAADERIWIHEADYDSVYDALSSEQPGLFSEYDEWGNYVGTAPALSAAWGTFTVEVPSSFGPSAELRWTAVSQQLLDLAAGHGAPQDVAAAKETLRQRLDSPQGADWHVYRANERIDELEASRLYVYVRGANGRTWQSGPAGARWADLSGVWQVPP